MARVALVSRNPAMSMGLSATKHAVVEIRPANFESWIESEDYVGFDALVLDLGSPQVASRVVGDLRAASHWIPVLLVATSDASWSDDSVAGLPNVRQLSFPIDPAKLQAAVDQVLSLPKSQPPIHVPSPEPEAKISVAEVTSSLPVLEPVPDLENLATPSFLANSEPEPPARPEPDVQAPPEPEPTPVPEIAPPPEPQPETEPERLPARKPKPPAAKTRTRHHSKGSTNGKGDEPPPLRLDPSEPPAEAHVAPRPTAVYSGSTSEPDPLHALLNSVDSMYTLQETAIAIVDDAVVRSRADAGALLVPDGSIWRVAAGVAIRPLEYRLQLTEEAWIIQNVASAGKGIIIEDSDVVRQALRGSPLASRPHLMAVPVPTVRAVVILARDENEPFKEADLGPLAILARESGPLLQQALDLRALARSLSKHLDSEQ